MILANFMLTKFNIWIYCLWLSKTSTRRFVKGEKNEQKINHLPQKVGAKDERVDLAHFLHPESSPCHILPISYSSKVVEIRQNDFQKCSKVFQYVQKFKDLKQRQRFCLRKGEERGIVFILSVGHFPGISLKFCRTVAAVDEYWF